MFEQNPQFCTLCKAVLERSNWKQIYTCINLFTQTAVVNHNLMVGCDGCDKYKVCLWGVLAALQLPLAMKNTHSVGLICEKL